MFRAYGDQPILAFRMILDGIVAPDDSVSFTGQTIPEIEKELAYWKTNKTARVARSRKEAPTAFPIPVRLFSLQVSKYIFHITKFWNLQNTVRTPTSICVCSAENARSPQ